MRLVLNTGASLRMQFFIRAIQPRGNVVHAAVVEQRDDLLLQQVVQRLALDLVLEVRVGVALAAADRPAQVGLIALDPPAVQDRAVQHAVGGRLHAAGAGGLMRPARRVEPHVHALHQVAGDVDVVVLEEDDPPADVGLAGETARSRGSAPCLRCRPGGPCRRR